MASMHLGVIYQEDEGKGWKLFFFTPKAFPSTLSPQARNYLYFIDQNYDIRPS